MHTVVLKAIVVVRTLVLLVQAGSSVLTVHVKHRV